MRHTFEIGDWVIADPDESDEHVAVAHADVLPFIGRVKLIEPMPSLDTILPLQSGATLVKLVSTTGQTARVPIHWLSPYEP